MRVAGPVSAWGNISRAGRHFSFVPAGDITPFFDHGSRINSSGALVRQGSYVRLARRAPPERLSSPGTLVRFLRLR